ncbi:MAG TPA: hypothetical protein VK525_11695 [Candidatus Saccharimonadales bacterium]|nr:hypothetical protein [Candidatus Saccharimonadales bacterium]
MALFFLLFLVPALNHSSRRIAYFLLFLLIRRAAVIGCALGTVWMLKQSLNRERRKWHYAALSFVPFMFVWYFGERYFLQTPATPEVSAAAREAPVRSAADPTAAMFCPLCKAGFREGFTVCSDCHLPLVGTQTEAQDCSVARLWKGKSRESFEACLRILQDEGIAHRFTERIKGQPVLQISILGFSLLPKKDALWNEYEIFVLRSDFARANAAIHSG